MFRKIFWKIINFSVPIEKEVTRTDEKEKKSQELHPTDYNLLIAQDLWQAHYQILYIILLKGIHKIKCKYRHDNKQREKCGIKCKDCKCCLEYKNIKEDLTEYKCLCCNKNYHEKIDENLKKWSFNTYKFSNHDINKFILLLRKSVYTYVYPCP